MLSVDSLSAYLGATARDSAELMLADRLELPPAAAHPDVLAQVVAWLESPPGVYLSIILLSIFLIWGGLAFLHQGIEYAVKKSLATAELHRHEFLALQGQQVQLLALLQRRDALYQEYQQALLLPPTAYADWNKRNWKYFARNQLAITKTLRPLTYADYRARVRGLSPSIPLRPKLHLAADSFQ